jgi:hypothetical protein
VGSGNVVGNDLVFNVGVNFSFPGPYWISAWVDAPTTGAQWKWLQTTPVHGSEGYVQNPGGGMGFGTNTTPLCQNPGATGSRDLSFRFTYTTIPEPPSFAALGVAMLGLLMFRHRRRA